MEHYKNKSLENIVEEIDGIVYTEEWKDVIGYEGIYKVSSFGRVMSVDRISNNKKIKGLFISQQLDRYGYPVVHLSKLNKQTHKKVHTLVVQAFIPNPENKSQINHKKGIKTENIVCKLEWATASENQKHAFETGLSIGKRGKDHYKNILSDIQVMEIFNSKESGIFLANKYMVHIKTISDIKTGRRRSYLTNKKYVKKYTHK
jgi:hypothetical protein